MTPSGAMHFSKSTSEAITAPLFFFQLSMLPIDLLLIIVSQSNTKAKPAKPLLGKKAYDRTGFSAGFEALSDLAIPI